MKDYKVEFTRLAKAFIESRKLTLHETEMLVRDELGELYRAEDTPEDFPMNIMFHTVFIGGGARDGVPLICTPKGEDTIRVDTASFEDRGPIKRDDGLFKGKRFSMPVPDTDDC